MDKRGKKLPDDILVEGYKNGNITVTDMAKEYNV